MIDTVTGSTATASLDAAHLGRGLGVEPEQVLQLGGAGSQAYGVAVLGVANDLGGYRGLAAQRPTELADYAIGTGGRASIQVNVLACQRGAPAIGAAMPVGLEGTDTATQQDALELFHMAGREGHGLKDSSSCAQLLPVWKSRVAGKVGLRAPSREPASAAA